MDDPREDDPRFSLAPELKERAQRWFAEAREQTRPDEDEITRWRRNNSSGGEGGGSSSDGGCGGGDAGGDGGD